MHPISLGKSSGANPKCHQFPEVLEGHDFTYAAILPQSILCFVSRSWEQNEKMERNGTALGFRPLDDRGLESAPANDGVEASQLLPVCQNDQEPRALRCRCCLTISPRCEPPWQQTRRGCPQLRPEPPSEGTLLKTYWRQTPHPNPQRVQPAALKQS